MSKNRRRMSPMEVKNHRILETAATIIRKLFIQNSPSLSPDLLTQALDDALKQWKKGLTYLASSGEDSERVTGVAMPKPPGYLHHFYSLDSEGKPKGFDLVDINDFLETDDSERIPPLSYIVYLKDGTYVYIDCTDLIVEMDAQGKGDREVN